MAKFLLVIIFTTLGCSVVWGQPVDSEAAVEWKRYGLVKKGFSVKMPKLPLRFDNMDLCNEMGTVELWAYAEDMVYEVRVVSKSGKKIPSSCAGASRFGPATFERRVQSASVGSTAPTETGRDSGGRQIYKSVLERSTRWIIGDMQNERWFELAVTHRAGTPVRAEVFLSSLALGPGSDVVEIGTGAGSIIGDSARTAPEAVPVISANGEKAVREPLVIALKKSPGYTDRARSENVWGTVVLKVTFNSNGSVGKIDAVQGLPFGLTEQAIETARKLVFLPAKVNGVPVSVVRTVEYTFKIY